MKKGKGRPKGYKPFIDITYEELGQWVGPKALVKVNTKWLEFLKGNLEVDSNSDVDYNSGKKIINVEEVPSPIEYNITRFDNE
tara:strand:- start:447 stop:695 length:249 start_codon:yes stop_codon:yes gene_type:complete